MEDVFENIWGDPTENSSIIKVIGVGGGGCNAVDHMYKLGIKDVGFVVCNTDAQALNNSPVPVKVQLGKQLTEGLGAGSNPDRGRQAAEESMNEISAMLRSNTKMVFITAGMGGGTGTGAAPVIAKVAKDMGILTVAIVTIPFSIIEPRRVQTAYEGINELRKHVDSLLVINNNKLHDLYGTLKVSEAFAKADDVLCTAAKGIAEIITTSGHINVDFADVRTAMFNSGIALMGTGRGTGPERASLAVEQAINSPLLNNNSIRGAKNVLVNVLMGANELTLEEFASITQRVIEETGSDLNVKSGMGYSAALGEDEVTVSIIATGFEISDIDPSKATEVPIHVTKAEPQAPQPQAVQQPGIQITHTDKPTMAGFDDEFKVNEPVSVSEPSSEIAGTHAVQRSIPKWLDDSIPMDEKEKPRPKAAANNRTEGEISLFSINKNGNGWDSSPASYINGKPD